MGRFDLSFKSLAERSPRTMIRLFGHVPVDDSMSIEPIGRELAMPILSVDHAFRVVRGSESWIEHFEAEVVLSGADLRQILRRAAMMYMKTDLPVWTTIVLLSRRNKPSKLPELARDGAGCVDLAIRPRVVSLWEMTPEVALEGSIIEMLPLVGAMKATAVELDEAIARMSRIADVNLRKEMSAEMVTWSALNYNEREVAGIRERLGMVTTWEVMMASSIGEELVEYGREKGLEEARRVARESLSVLLAARFPGLMAQSVIDGLDNLDTIHAILRAVGTASTAAEAYSATSAILASNGSSKP